MQCQQSSSKMSDDNSVDCRLHGSRAVCGVQMLDVIQLCSSCSGHITHYMTHNMRTGNNMTHNNAVTGEPHHQTVKIVGLKIIKRILMIAV